MLGVTMKIKKKKSGNSVAVVRKRARYKTGNLRIIA